MLKRFLELRLLLSSRLLLSGGLVLGGGLVLEKAQANLIENTACHYTNVYQQIECLEEENKQFIDDINDIYSTLKSDHLSVYDDIPRSEYLTSFTESQKAWTAFTQVNCEMLNLPYAKVQGGGIGLVYKKCWNDAYRLRFNQLNEWMSKLEP